jgi:hypothetical protein
MSVVRRVVFILVFLIPLACGSADKGKNKTSDGQGVKDVPRSDGAGK